jgi:hypothetical protein
MYIVYQNVYKTIEIKYLVYLLIYDLWFRTGHRKHRIKSTYLPDYLPLSVNYPPLQRKLFTPLTNYPPTQENLLCIPLQITILRSKSIEPFAGKLTSYGDK